MTTGWHPTGALVRAATTAAVVVTAGLLLGRPDLLVLGAPFGLVAALGLAHLPRAPVVGRVVLGDRWLHEGQSTRLRVQVDSAAAIEQATATLSPPAFVVTQPPSGNVAATPEADDELALELVISPRRWGVRPIGTCLVAATSPWGGYRWGPQRLPEATFVALPEARAFTSAESPRPVGLVGQHRSRRGGGGSEFYAIRPFQPGDRVRRVNWRTTLRTGQVHAVGTTAQEDSSLLILLDAVTDVGASGGLDGDSSALDAGVRAASALAAHHIGIGDRVALRVLGRQCHVLGPGTGIRHQRRLQELLAEVRPGWPDLLGARRLRFRAGAGTVVVVLSPMLTPEITTAMLILAGRGLTVVALDTLAPVTLPAPARDPHSAARLAWRMRLVERQMHITEVTRHGIPVVPWHGSGTLDEVLRRLARRARTPREVSR
jgi:uncharacterized protein (DUF58 family)